MTTPNPRLFWNAFETRISLFSGNNPGVVMELLDQESSRILVRFDANRNQSEPLQIWPANDLTLDIDSGYILESGSPLVFEFKDYGTMVGQRWESFTNSFTTDHVTITEILYFPERLNPEK